MSASMPPAAQPPSVTHAPSVACPFLDPCSQVFPDYKERVVRHEAAHFLTGAGQPFGLLHSGRTASASVAAHPGGRAAHWIVLTACHRPAGYLLGVPVANYSLTLGKEHTDFAGGQGQGQGQQVQGQGCCHLLLGPCSSRSQSTLGCRRNKSIPFPWRWYLMALPAAPRLQRPSCRSG